jgi:hypothetical protein
MSASDAFSGLGAAHLLHRFLDVIEERSADEKANGGEDTDVEDSDL